MTDVEAELVIPTITPPPGAREAEQEATGIKAPLAPSISAIEPNPQGTLLQRAAARGETSSPLPSSNLLTITEELAQMNATEQRLETEAALGKLGNASTTEKKTILDRLLHRKK